MVSLEQIEADITAALKARNQLAADTLRGLKVRVQNEKIAKMQDVLSGEDIVRLVQSEVKRRKEAAASFLQAGRQESADKEMSEASVLEQYLPAQLSREDITRIVEEIISATAATAADFGKVMGAVKARVGQTADGSVVAALVKEKLK